MFEVTDLELVEMAREKGMEKTNPKFIEVCLKRLEANRELTKSHREMISDRLENGLRFRGRPSKARFTEETPKAELVAHLVTRFGDSENTLMRLRQATLVEIANKF